MAFLCCGFRCNRSTRTPVVSLEERQPVQCDLEKTTTGRRNKQSKRSDKYRQQNWEETTCLPGQLLDDHLIERPRLIPERTFVEFATNSLGRDQYQKHMRIAARQYLVRSPVPTLNPQGRTPGLETSSQQRRALTPVQEVSPNQRFNLAREAEGIHTAVHGSAPRPMPWKDLYESVMKPREQIMSIYNTTAARYANRNPRGVLNVSPASDGSAERVEVRTPLGQREDRLRALRTRLRQKLKNRRRRPTPATNEWHIETVISDSEDGDEEDEILYSTYRTHQDCGCCDSHGNDGHESEREAGAASSRHSLGAQDGKQQSRAAFTPDPHTAAQKSSTPTRQASRSSFCLEPVIISRPTSSDDVDEVFVLPEEDAQPARPRRTNVLVLPEEVLKPTRARRGNVVSRALKRMSKRPTRVFPSADVEPPATRCAWADSSNGDSPEDRTAPSTPAAESQAKDHPDVNMAPAAVERSATEDPPRAARERPRLFVRRFNAFEKPSRDC